MKILLVEDEESVRRFIKVYLEFEGFQVVEAGNGREALEKVREESPDLVVTDIMMPEMDGIQFYKAMKESEGTRAIPIIVLTVRNSFDDVQQAYLTGIEEYLTKPFDPKLLVEKIHEISPQA